MKKKLVSVLMCMAMGATLLAGCGSEEAADSSNTTAADAADANTAADSEAADASDAADAADAADGDVITIGFAQVGHESDWRTASTNSAQSIFSAENGYDLQFVDCDQDSAVQLEAVRGFIEQDVDYIIIDPIVSTGWDTVLTECEEAGIPVIVIDRTIDDSDKYISWVGSNFKLEGQKAMAWLDAYLEAKGRGDEEINLVDIQGTIGASAQVGRTEGMENKLKEHSNWNMLDKQSGEFTQAKGQEVMESFLKSYDDIDVVICENDNEAFGAIDAIKAAGKTCGPEGDIIVVSFDSVKAAFESMIAGDLNATFECNPLHGPRVAEIIQKLEKGEEVEKIQYVDEAYFDTSMDLEEILKTRAY